MMKKAPRILIVSHSNLFRRSLAALLKHINDTMFISVISPQKAISKIRESQPTSVIIDIPFTDFAALNLLYKINKQYHNVNIIIITDNLAPAFLMQLFRMRITACLSKHCSATDLTTAIKHDIHDNKKIFCDEEVSKQIAKFQNKTLTKIRNLTRQEFQIVVMLAHGIKTEEIAKQLHLSIKTVSSYHTQILDKLNLEHNVEIVQFAYKHQLLFLPVKFPSFLN